MQKVAFFIHCPFKNNSYIKRIVIVHLNQNISCGSHAVTTLGVIWNNATQYYFVTTDILPSECVGILNVNTLAYASQIHL